LALMTGFLHLVYFYPVDNAGADDAATLQKGCRKWLPGIPSVLRMEAGFPAGTDREVVDNTYAVGLLVEFADQAGHDLYNTHPDHLAFIAENKHLWSRVQIYDTLL
jgi:hypothetical protein